MSEPKPCQGCGYVIRCKCVPVRYADNLTNLTDEGLSKLTSELVDEAREVLTGMVAGKTTFKKFWEPRILTTLQQVRDAAKLENRSCACEKKS